MGQHDALYRQLFKHPQLLRDLLTCVMEAQWLQNLDWHGLQPLDSSFVGERLQQRIGDCVWRIPYRSGSGDLYVLLMLENQSRPDPQMALRLAAYAALLYQTLLRGKLAALPLPPILPVVLYSGTRRWKAAQNLSELIDPRVQELAAYQLQIRYLLVDEAALLSAGGLPDLNLAALLFRLEHSRSIEQLPELLQTLRQALRGPAFAELDRSFTAYVQYLVLARAQPLEPPPAATNLQELAMLISEKPGMWAKQWERQGRKEGLQEGLQKGHQEGAADTLSTQLAARFGTLPDWVSIRLLQANTDELKCWTLRVLDAERLEDVFKA